MTFILTVAIGNLDILKEELHVLYLSEGRSPLNVYP